MRPHRLFVPFIVAILCSCTTARPVPEAATGNAAATSGPIAVTRTGLVAVGADGAIWLVRAGSRVLEKWPAGSASAAFRVEATHPPLAIRAAGGGVVAAAIASAAVVDSSGETVFEDALDVSGAERLERRRGSLAFVTAAGEREVSVAWGTAAAARLLAGGRAVALVRGRAGDSIFALTASDRDAQRIAGPFPAIDSFDVSPDGLEVAFSAKRGNGFDIGLVASDGSEVRWIGPDPLDERTVKWAPRGNKIAYVMDGPTGTVVRSVHIPTGFQLSAPLPLSRVQDLAWDPQAERLALLVTAADAAERVDMMRFDGSERQTVMQPAARASAPDQLAGVPEAVVFAPEAVRYNEKLPLVIWEEERGPFVFHERRARLQQNRRVGSVVVSPGTTATPAFWSAVAELAWVDRTKVFVVASDSTGLEEIPETFQVTVLTAEGGSARSSERVTIVRGGSGPLEDFAVDWLRERLRGFEREHDGD